MNYISFVTSASRENANFRFFVFFWPGRRFNNQFLLLISFHKLGWKFKLNASKLRDNLKFRNSEKLPVNFRSAHLKNQRCSALPQRKSVLISPDSAQLPLIVLFSMLFRTESALFRAESALFRCFQVVNSTELELKHFWIQADKRWLSLRRQPGLVNKAFNFCLILYLIKYFLKVFQWFNKCFHA